MRLQLSSTLTAAFLSAYILAGCQSSASQSVSANAPNSVVANAAAAPAAATTAPGAPADAKPFDPCPLLTSDDIKDVQGEAVSETKPSRRDDPNFRISQCFYTTPTFTKSVSLEVTQRGAGAQGVREMWKENFARYETKREAKNERRKKKGKPQAGPAALPVKGVGDEAYWVGTNANGTLYAFKKDSLVRISIGGPDEDASRLRKASTLARKALARL